MSEKRIAIIGLGYVGLPLAIEFAKQFSVTGFDINKNRVDELINLYDSTLEIDCNELKLLLKKECTSNKGLYVTNKTELLKEANIFIVTVPTPVDKHNHPDLAPLYKASEIIGTVLKKNDVVIFESTVYPGVTEEECVPILEKISGLIFNKDFYVGYSPERINPGDKKHTLTQIKKITSGSTPEIAETINLLYASIISAGTHMAPSIKVAEAAKVIENAQRDINIAFVNELAKICGLLNLDTNDVLEAAATKWNFLPFKPGLVGGHCIGVDPYYLTQKAQEIGYHPEIILAGRRLNDGMGAYIADEVIKLMVRKGIQTKDSEVLILGFTYKENCTDTRNTRVAYIIKRLQEYHMKLCIYDPLANLKEADRVYKICCRKNEIEDKKFDAVILAVAHDEFRNLNIQQFKKPQAVVFDVKSVLDRNLVDGRL